MASQKVTLTKNAEGAYVAACEDAQLLDILTTMVSADQAVTGAYGFLQKGALIAGGMVLQEYRRSGSLNPL